MAITRPDLKPAKYGRLTQGSVFTCATAERYPNKEVFGLVITARCDVAQNKYPVLNYLPVVRLESWLRQDGLDILIANEQSVSRGNLVKALKQAQISTTLLNAVTLAEIAEKNFPLCVGTKAQQKAANEFRMLVARALDFENQLQSQNRDVIFTWFRTNQLSSIEDLVSRLSRHAVPGYYFVECLDVDRVGVHGYVCLLREVNTMAKIIAEQVGNGLSKELFFELGGADKQSLKYDFCDLAMPIVEIGSPTIEHLMQSFSNLFGRVGISDPDSDLLGKIFHAAILSEGTLGK